MKLVTVPKTGGGLNITMSSMVVVTCLTWITVYLISTHSPMSFLLGTKTDWFLYGLGTK